MEKTLLVEVKNGIARLTLNRPGVFNAFSQEMRAAGANWQLIMYGDAVHSFTDPAAGEDPTTGSAYNPIADRRSWQLMQDFLRECFESP